MHKYKSVTIMKAFLGLFISAIWLSGVRSAEQLTQSEAVVIKPGNSHTLTCTVSGFTFSNYYMSWVREIRGKLQWIGEISGSGGTINCHNDLKGRYTISRDNSNNILRLKMDNMKTEDTVVYYCARHPTGMAYYFDIWGQGTLVTVTAASPSAPSLFPLISCGTSQEQKTTIGCLAKDFLPDSIDFNWTDKVNATYSEDLKKYKYVLQSTGKYAATSQVKVPTDSWENSDNYYYCTAKHPQGTKTVLLKWPHEVARKPIVTIHPPAKDDVEFNGNATIACIIHGFFPIKIEVSWKKNHDSPLNAIKEEAVSDGNGSFRMTSYITVSKLDWDEDIIFSCIVKHAASDFYETKNISKSLVCDSQVTAGEIKVTVKPPSFETIYFEKTAPLTCIISNMESKDGLEVSWYSNKEKLNTKIEDPVYDSALRRYRATATASVFPEDWKKNSFECSVSHPELPRVTNVSLSKPNGQFSRPPIVLLYPPHPEELAKKETATLSCLVKSFTPADIFVKWLDSNGKEQSGVVTTDPKEEISSSSKKTYFIYSTLTLKSVEEWNNGKAFTCVVGHESLPMQSTQRTIDKSAGKPNHVNVSLVMSDSC